MKYAKVFHVEKGQGGAWHLAVKNISAAVLCGI